MVEKVKTRIGCWLAVVLYVVFIYTSLGVAPQCWQYIDSLLCGKGMFAQDMAYAAIGFALFFYLVYIKKENRLSKYFWFFGCAFAAWFVLHQTPLAAEKIHLVEYGVLGALLYSALKHETDYLGPKLYICAALLCIAIGAVDEVIQFFLPNRFFGWRDIFMNGISGIISLCLIRFSIINDTL